MIGIACALLMRACTRHRLGLYALACDEEASVHYGIDQHGIDAWLWRLYCYLSGFLSG